MNKYAKKFKESIEDIGYKLVTEYKNCSTKVTLICNKDHMYEVKPNNFNNGQRCPKCSGKCSNQAKERFINLLYDNGYKLVGEYKNIMTRVDVECPDGHLWNCLPNDFKRGNRCIKCSKRCPEQSEKDFKLLVQESGYKLLSEYNGVMKHVNIECDNGHVYMIRPNDFKKGYRCSVCAKQNVIDRTKEDFINQLNREGYYLVGNYVNTMTKTTVKCCNDHSWEMVPNDFRNSYSRCPHCKGSTGQRLLQSMIEDRGMFGIYNDRIVLGGLELDIYYPELNIAIEYQGNYWHSLPEAIERDNIKKVLCNNKGIKLIEVWDNEFLFNPDKIVNNLTELLQSIEK